MTAEQQIENLNHLMGQLLVFMGQFAEESKAFSQRVEIQLGQLGQETQLIVQQVEMQNGHIAQMTEAFTMNCLDLLALDVRVDRQVAAAPRQEQNLTRLVGILETLVQRTAA